MNRNFAPLVAATLSLLASTGGGAQTPGPAAYTVLDDNATQLREDFNKTKGTVRLLFVVDPICPGCLRGLDDMDQALLKKTSDPRLQTFVVHVPVLGAKAKTSLPRPSCCTTRTCITIGTSRAPLAACSRTPLDSVKARRNGSMPGTSG